MCNRGTRGALVSPCIKNTMINLTHKTQKPDKQQITTQAEFLAKVIKRGRKKWQENGNRPPVISAE